MARDRRRLGPEDEALWSAVKRSVTPLHPERPTPRPTPPPTPEAAAPQAKTKTAMRPVLPAAVPAKPVIPPLHPLGRRERQKLVRGSTDIDARLDLHGLTQDQAHARLSGFLAHAQANGYKLVLVITGKGRSDGGFETLHGPERGVLRRVVPLWLSLPEFRRTVVGFEEAHLAHGGGGALYIRIRKKK